MNLLIKPIDHNAPSPVTDIIKELCSQNAKILELGCGNGRNLTKLRNYGFKALFGLDKDKSKIEEAKKKVKEATFFCGNILNFNSKHKFDVVFHVLMGIFLSPKERKILIEKVKKHLKPSGYYLFEELIREHSKRRNSPPYFYSLRELEELKKRFKTLLIEKMKRIVKNRVVSGGIIYVGKNIN